MTKYIVGFPTTAKIFLFFGIYLISAQSCVGPWPVTYYEPLNEGKRIGSRDTSNVKPVLRFDIHNGVEGYTMLGDMSGEFVHNDDEFNLYFYFIVPKGKTVRLASDKVEIHSPELNSPVIVRVKSIRKKVVKRSDGKPEFSQLGTYEELYGCETCNYTLIFESINKNQVPEESPENVTLFLPQIYINDEIHKIEPLRYKLTRTIRVDF